MLLEEGDITGATAEYTKLKGHTETLECATDGLQEVDAVARALADAVDAQIAGLHDEAKATLAALFKTYPTANFTAYLVSTYGKEASGKEANAAVVIEAAAAVRSLGFIEASDRLIEAAVRGVPSKPGFNVDLDNAGPFIAAVLLERLGYHDQALAAFKDVSDDDPRTTAAILATKGHPREIDTLERDAALTGGLNWWQRFKGWIVPLARTVGEIVLIILLAIVVARIIRATLRSPMELKTFVDPDAATTKIANDLTALVSSSISQLRTDLPGKSLTLVTALEATTVAFPTSLASDVPQSKVLQVAVSLFQKSLPQRGWSVSGQLQAKGPKGVGLALRLAQANGKVRDEVVLWEQTFHPDGSGSDDDTIAAYDRLAIPAAVWIVYKIRGLIQGSLWHPIVSRRIKDSVLATRDWKSYALFAAGALLQEEHDLAGARSLYDRALRRDPMNRGALYNAAAIDIGDLRFDLASDRLRRLEQQLNDDPEADRTSDPLWYRFLYMKGVLEIHRVEAPS